MSNTTGYLGGRGSQNGRTTTRQQGRRATQAQRKQPCPPPSRRPSSRCEEPPPPARTRSCTLPPHARAGAGPPFWLGPPLRESCCTLSALSACVAGLLAAAREGDAGVRSGSRATTLAAHHAPTLLCSRLFVCVPLSCRRRTNAPSRSRTTSLWARSAPLAPRSRECTTGATHATPPSPPRSPDALPHASLPTW